MTKYVLQNVYMLRCKGVELGTLTLILILGFNMEFNQYTLIGTRDWEQSQNSQGQESGSGVEGEENRDGMEVEQGRVST